MRVLPDFLVIGAQKGGTSSLFHYLSQHPSVIPPSRKEVHFFDGGSDPRVDDYRRGLRWYRRHFPLRWSLAAGQVTGEASPTYLYNPLVPSRIRSALPDVRMVALLRDPVDRAISHYFHVLRAGRETLPLLEALEAEDERMANAMEDGSFKRESYRWHSYKLRGRYAEHLKRYWSLFPREQLLVLRSEDLFEAPASTMTEVFRHLGIDASARIPDLAPRNVGTRPSATDARIHEYLSDYFKVHNDELFELLNRDLGWPR